MSLVPKNDSQKSGFKVFLNILGAKRTLFLQQFPLNGFIKINQTILLFCALLTFFHCLGSPIYFDVSIIIVFERTCLRDAAIFVCFMIPFPCIQARASCLFTPKFGKSVNSSINLLICQNYVEIHWTRVRVG
jgi:hypothetical protein